MLTACEISALLKEYIYGPNGLSATIEPTSINSNGTRYITADHLGSTRVVTNSSGSVISRHDYMPFGIELGSGVGGRTSGMGYDVTDNVRQKFTQKERDAETGLDYFGARYFSSMEGRFTGCDPRLLSLKQVVNPQRWNRYAYVVNNPLALYDPDGQDDQGKGGGKVIDVFITIPPDQQKDYRTVNGKPAGEFKTPDWAKIQENAKKSGYTVNVHQLNESTPQAVANSLANSELTVIVGHGIDINPQNPTKFTSEAAALNGGLIGDGGAQPATMDGTNIVATGEAIPITGTGTVGLFTCNSTDVLSNAFPGRLVISNDGGPDGLTTLGALQSTAATFVGTYVDTGGDANAATTAAQGTLSRTAVRVVNEPAPNGGQATNRKDQLRIRRVRYPEEEQ